MSKDLRSVQQGLVGDVAAVEELKRHLATLKADGMNRTLYALTLVMTLSVPIAFFSQVWALNLAAVTAALPGLGDADAAGPANYWALLVGVCAAMGAAMARLGLFEAVK